jgi:hypothetical protein
MPSSQKGSVAYDCSKAAANHLVRELAIELSPLVRVNGVAPAPSCKAARCSRATASSARSRSTTFPTRTTKKPTRWSRKLAQFYADRTLTKSPITPADQAEAYFLLISNRLSKTTGQVITVDGGCTRRSCGKQAQATRFSHGRVPGMAFEAYTGGGGGGGGVGGGGGGGGGGRHAGPRHSTALSRQHTSNPRGKLPWPLRQSVLGRGSLKRLTP